MEAYRKGYLLLKPCMEIGVSRHKIKVWRDGEFRGTAYEYVEIPAGVKIKPSYHAIADERLEILEGSGLLLLKEKRIQYKPKKVFDVPHGTWHGFRAGETTLLLSMQTPQIIDWETGIMDIHYE